MHVDSRRNFPAVGPDLSSATRQWRNVPHFHHRLCKLVKELLLALRISLHQLQRLFILCHQHLVRAQQPPESQQIPEVAVVEARGRDEVEGEEVLVPPGLRAPRPKLGCVRLLQAHVRLPVSGLVVQPLSEACASCLSYGVASCNKKNYNVQLEKIEYVQI